MKNTCFIPLLENKLKESAGEETISMEHIWIIELKG